MMIIKGRSRDCEKVVHNEGCVVGSGYNIEWDMSFEGDTVEELLENLVDYHDVELDSILIEDDMLVVSSHEKQIEGRWLNPTEKDMDNWRSNKQELYHVDYIYKFI